MGSTAVDHFLSCFTLRAGVKVPSTSNKTMRDGSRPVASAAPAGAGAAAAASVVAADAMVIVGGLHKNYSCDQGLVGVLCGLLSRVV